MKKITLLILFAISITIVHAQAPSYKFKFQYRISNEKLKKLGSDPKPYLFVTDTNGVRYTFCDRLERPFKCLISYDPAKRILLLDSWVIKAGDDSCQKTGIINSKTSNVLRIVLPPRRLIGDTTVAVRFPYQSWIIGINSIGVKFRTRVRDYRDSIYAPNVISGNLNLGFSVGYSFGWTNFKSNNLGNNSFSITPSICFGFSSASLSKEPLKKLVNISRNPSNFVLSPSISVIVARNDIGLILAYGREIMMGSNASAWAYQGKGFFGFGISAGLKL